MLGDKQIYFFLVLCTISVNGWFWNTAPSSQRWKSLQVTYLKFSHLPKTSVDAENGGWKKTASCDESSYFRGNRYVLGDDKSTMVLYDSSGNFAGIQFGIAKSLAQHSSFHKSHWNHEGDSLVLTAYFVHPSVICNGERHTHVDNLYIQTGPSPRNLMNIPYLEQNIGSTSWVKGRCFLLMGQHYWFNISKDMSCDDSFPVFLLYNKGELTGFGWAMFADLRSTSRVEHPEPSDIGYFFKEETAPRCLTSEGLPFTTQHIYLKSWPYTILCPLFG